MWIARTLRHYRIGIKEYADFIKGIQKRQLETKLKADMKSRVTMAKKRKEFVELMNDNINKALSK
jgi:hypothetical protein